MMAAEKQKPLMRSLGEFFGHVVKGIKTDPAKDRETQKTVVKKEVQEEDRGDMVLRRTTIEEIEIKRDAEADRNSHEP